MASEAAYLTMKWLHVLAAGLVVGGPVVMEIVRVRSRDATGRRARGVVWPALGASVRAMQAALALLLVTGLLMVYGPAATSGWDLLRDRWILSGLVLVVVIGALLGGLAGGAGKRLAKAYGEGKEETPDLAGAERKWRLAVVASLALAVLAVALMTFKPAT